MSILTIGDLDDALFLDGMEIQTEKNYIHHYNFPPSSVGETGRLGSPGRREIGHGNLAEKALRRMIPSKEDFPYTMRVVSEVTSSQGSTSMASTCASTLALLSGGVPIKKAVAGIAIGLVSGDNDYKILTDILGYEDFYGDMDFKVAGTRDGITAIQLDLKIDGLSLEMIGEILDRANSARNEVLNNMEATISQPAEMSPNIEKIERMKIPENKIGLVIGKGGANIKRITKESGAKVDIKRDGTAFIYGNGEKISKAKDLINDILEKSIN
jgi:polyribonucleotide nucleotidyltransferase